MSTKSDKKRDLKGVKAPKPLRSSIYGINLVTIPLADYAALLDAKKRLNELDSSKPRRFPASPIERNPEVRDFILERFGKLKHADTIAECKAKFGWAPSKSALDRFFQRCKRGD
jgi:hypothetical protein